MIDETLDGWAIVITNGIRLVGNLTRHVLSPVYEMAPKWVIAASAPNAPPTLFANGFTIVSVNGYDSIGELDVPPHAVIIPVSMLSPSDRANLAKGIDGWETMKRQARSSVLIAPAGAMPPVRRSS